jgi:hypothetical protein
LRLARLESGYASKPKNLASDACGYLQGIFLKIFFLLHKLVISSLNTLSLSLRAFILIINNLKTTTRQEKIAQLNELVRHCSSCGQNIFVLVHTLFIICLKLRDE